jgi:hypothetical protein
MRKFAKISTRVAEILEFHPKLLSHQRSIHMKEFSESIDVNKKKWSFLKYSTDKKIKERKWA